MMGSIKCPARPAKLWLSCSEGEACSSFGYVARNHNTIETPRMMVPARFKKRRERSHMCNNTDLKEGILYGGSSMIKAGASLFKSVFLKTQAIERAAVSPRRYIATRVSPGNEKIPNTVFLGMNAAIMR